MDSPTASARVLAQPTRGRVFDALAALRRPAATKELSEGLGLHPNGVRVHLERLVDAGLVTRERVRQPVGRPRDMWTVAPDAQADHQPPRAYAELGGWLTSAMVRNRTSLRAVEGTGRHIGRGLSHGGERAPDEQRMFAALTAMGFRPGREREVDGELTYRLGNCPYRDAVREGPEIVCTLHRGITRGLLDTIAPDTKLTGFVPRDPDSAGCLIRLRGGLARGAPAPDLAGDEPDAG